MSIDRHIPVPLRYSPAGAATQQVCGCEDTCAVPSAPAAARLRGPTAPVLPLFGLVVGLVLLMVVVGEWLGVFAQLTDVPFPVGLPLVVIAGAPIFLGVPRAAVRGQVNDAPALAQADVGITVGAAGSDIALEAAHIALLREDPTLIPQAVRIARRDAAAIRLNIGFTAGCNALGLTLAATGLLPIMLAAAAQSLPDLGILANSSRLLRSPTGRALRALTWGHKTIRAPRPEMPVAHEGRSAPATATEGRTHR